MISNDIRDIFREEFQNALNHLSVQDAYAKILGAIEHLRGIHDGPGPEMTYAAALEEAHSDFGEALKRLKLVEVDLVQQNVWTKSLVLGPYIAGINGLITCYQAEYWSIAKSNSPTAYLWFDSGRGVIKDKIKNLRRWIEETRAYLRSFSKIKITEYCADGFEEIREPCDDIYDIRLREPAGGWCIDYVCKGFAFECYHALYYNTDPHDAYDDIGWACLDEHGSQEQSKDAIDAMIDNYINAITPTLLVGEMTIGA